MKKGSGLNSVVIFIIVAFVLFKVVAPKFINKTGDNIGIYTALTELENAIDEFRKYYLKNGNFTTINIMTYVTGFENSSQKLEFNKPIKYGVLGSDGVMNYCTELTITNNNGEFMELKPINSRSEICRTFVDEQRFQNLRKTPLKF